MIHIYYKLSFSFKISRVGRCFSLSLGGGVRPASQNPYPIYDQNLRYSLPYLGMDDKTWTINYLSDRRHFVQIDDRRSDMAHVAFGVPQGSILSPVIFNLKVADLQNNVNCQILRSPTG